MLDDETFWRCERGFWLDGLAHYEKHLAPSARMVFPEPAGILHFDQIIEGIAGAPRWDAVVFEETGIARIDDVAVLTYRATGRRLRDDPYRALCSSTYVVVDGVPALLSHQHTPCG